MKVISFVINTVNNYEGEESIVDILLESFQKDIPIFNGLCLVIMILKIGLFYIIFFTLTTCDFRKCCECYSNINFSACCDNGYKARVEDSNVFTVVLLIE